MIRHGNTVPEGSGVALSFCGRQFWSVFVYVGHLVAPAVRIFILQSSTIILICLAILSVALLRLELALSSAKPDPQFIATARAAATRWKKLCHDSSGPFIYKTAAGVEGVQLLKVRHAPESKMRYHQMRPDAAMANELKEAGYISKFLQPEIISRDLHTHRPVPIMPENDERGLLPGWGEKPPSIYIRPGYRYVDAPDEETGEIMRYTLDEQGKLQKSPAPLPRPRYGVTFEDHVIPEDRAQGIASSTIQVLDLQTGEVMGAFNIYAFTNAFFGDYYPGKTENAWEAADACPGPRHTSVKTRYFVDNVLYPIGR